MRVTAKVDYAVRACVELARLGASSAVPAKGDQVAAAQDIPIKYLENILGQLRSGGIVASRRGAEGGYWLARSADRVHIAEIIRAIEGPLANVRGERPEEVRYPGEVGALAELWVAVRASLRNVLDVVTVADVVGGELPEGVRRLLDEPDAWNPR